MSRAGGVLEEAVKTRSRILVDKEIREYAQQHRMIEPFVEAQKSTGLISYGLSSMGYDLRVADEYKVFQPEIRVRHLSAYEQGYVAAILDGEGCIQSYNLGRNNGLKQLKITIGNTNLELLEKLKEVIGTGAIYHRPSKNPKHADAYVLNISRTSDIQYLLSQVYPFLIVKRQRALEALEKFNKSSIVVDPKDFNPDSFVDIKSSHCIIPPNSFALARSLEYLRIPRSILGICIGKSSYARCGIVVNITPLEPEWEGHLTIEISNTTPLPAKIYSNEGIAQLIFLESATGCETSYGDRKGKYQAQRGITLPKVIS